MKADRSGSSRAVKSWLRRRLAVGAGSVLVATCAATLPAEAAIAKRPADEGIAARAAAARAALETAPRNSSGAEQLELTWWGNWHNWGWHPWWHNWPNWRNWNNWGNGPGAFSGCG